MASCYAPLRLQSNYSLLSGASSIGSLLDRTAELGLEAVALTDLNNLYGTVPFVREAQERGIHPIIGVRVEHETGSGTLLARNLEGYRNLCRVVTRRQLDAGFSFADCVSRFPGGLHVLVGDPSQAKGLVEAVDRRCLWLEIPEPAAYRRVREDARRLGVRPVAAEEVLFARRGEHGRHKVLTAIRQGTAVSRLRAGDVAGPGAHLREAGEMTVRWRDLPEALRHTLDIAEDCELAIPGGRWVFPSSDLERLAATRKLRDFCRRGLEWRYERVPAAARERLDTELRVIGDLGFTDYFLIVAEIVRFARDRGIPTVGRGSGAGSLVAYLLGITNVDPIRYGLCFERFLHEKREDCPDLDIDFCWRGRDEVIDHVYETYGDERVAMISTHNLFHFRSAFREVSKAFGLAPEEITILSKRLRGRGVGASGSARLREIAGQSDLIPTILRVTRELEGFPRHLGIHSGGIVIADTRLDDYVSLERATKGLVVTQPDMRGVEALGLVKMDLLGNRALSTIRETVGLVRSRGNGNLQIEPVPDGDPETGDLLAAGATLGCFQIESPGMRSLLAKLRVNSLGGTIAALSLIRPGPASSGMKGAYVRRASGLEAVSAPDPRIADALSDTYGVMLYQEDVMRVASEVTGVPLSEADLLRRAIAGAESRHDLESLGRGFVQAARANGFRGEVAEDVWGRLTQFSSYSFCKAHASGYGALAYQSAYLKAHYPVEFAAAIMNNHQGMYPPWVHLEEARRRGVEFRGPCLNTSSDGFTVEEGIVRVGLGQVRGLGETAIQAIVETREAGGEFRGLADFQERVEISLPEVEALVLAGALDFTGRTRPELLWDLHAFHRKRQQSLRSPEVELLLDGAPAPRLGLRDFSPSRAARHEFEVLEVSLREHPLRWTCRELGRDGLVAAGRPPMAPGKLVRVVGLLSATRSVETKQGEKMGFLTLDDESGPFECVLFPDVYRHERARIDGWGPYEVQGRVEEEFGVFTLNVYRLRRVERHSASLVL
jgi:DNA-directed DNA polymerase III PolC